MPILCVHVRKLGTSVHKSTRKIDISAVRSRQTAHLSFREEIYESEVTDFVVSQALCMHACDRHRGMGFWELAILA